MEQADDSELLDERLEVLRKRFETKRERLERSERSQQRKARRERFQRDMGMGYLFYVARRYRRLSQDRLARRMGTSRQVVTRWESGARLPSLTTLEKLAGATDLELLIGFRGAEDPNGDLLALGIVFDEGCMTELLMLIDHNTDQLRPAPWRLKMVEQHPEDAAVLL